MLSLIIPFYPTRPSKGISGGFAPSTPGGWGGPADRSSAELALNSPKGDGLGRNKDGASAMKNAGNNGKEFVELSTELQGPTESLAYWNK